MLKYILALTFLTYSAASFAAPQCSDMLDTVKSDGQEAIKSGVRIKNYFSAVQGQMVEREYVVKAMLNAIIAKEHLLMVGPPGNAKTTLTKLVFEGITEEGTGKSSFFATQMTAETSLSDTHGGINYKTLQETGKQDRLYEEGILGARLALLDELFDMRPNGYRNTLDVLAERAHAQGGKKHKGRTWTVVGASNTFIPDVYAKFDGSEQPRAMIDRYAYVLFVPAEMEKNSSNRLIVQGSQKERTALPEVTFQDFENVQKLVSQVEIPNYVSDIINLLHFRLRTVFESKEEASLQEYKEKVLAGEKPLPPYKSTKYLSPRTLGKAAGVVRASVAFDYVNKNGQRKLSVQTKDLEELINFYSLGGPADAFIQKQISRASKEVEKEQLKTILWERKVVRETLNAILAEYNQKLTGMGSQNLYAKIRDYNNLPQNERRELMDMLRALYIRGREISNLDQDVITPEMIAEVSISDLVPKWLSLVNPVQAQEIISSWEKSAPITKKINATNRYQAVTEGTGSLKALGTKSKKQSDNTADKTALETTPKAEVKAEVAKPNQPAVQKPNGKGIKIDRIFTTENRLKFLEAVNFKYYTVMQNLLEKGFDPNSVIYEDQQQSWHPLNLLIHKGNLEGVRLLLDHGADPTERSRFDHADSRDALEWAEHGPDKKIVKLIENHLAKKNQPAVQPLNEKGVVIDPDFTTLNRRGFYDALSAQKNAYVLDLLKSGFDPNIVIHKEDYDTWNPLRLAIFTKNSYAVKLLLMYGANPGMRSASMFIQRNAWEWAKYYGAEDIVKMIQEHLATQVQKTSSETNPVTQKSIAINQAYTNELVAKSLQSDYKKFDSLDFEGYLRNGFDPNAIIIKNEHQTYTILGVAAWNNQTKTIKLLLKYGADPKVMSNQFAHTKDSLGWAKHANQTEAIKILEEYYRQHGLQI